MKVADTFGRFSYDVMMKLYSGPPRLPPPINAEDGAARLRVLLVQLFDRKDGTGADWRMMLESLYRAGFQIADDWPDGDARRSLMRRVHEGAYIRLTDESDANNSPALGGGSAPSNIAAPKSNGPRPPC